MHDDARSVFAQKLHQGLVFIRRQNGNQRLSSLLDKLATGPVGHLVQDVGQPIPSLRRADDNGLHSQSFLPNHTNRTIRQARIARLCTPVWSTGGAGSSSQYGNSAGPSLPPPAPVVRGLDLAI